MIKAKVFIGSSKEGLMLAKLVNTIMSKQYEVLVWSNFFKGTRIPLSELEQKAEIVDFAILIASPDDKVDFRGVTLNQMRDNVLFEYGLFSGKIGRKNHT